jgi:PleD family two-component response regulator
MGIGRLSAASFGPADSVIDPRPLRIATLGIVPALRLRYAFLVISLAISRLARAMRSAVQMNRSVVIVDDDPAVLETLESVLSAEGFEVRTFQDGQDAIRVLQ